MMSFEADACTDKKPKTKKKNSNQKKKPKCQSSERFDRDGHNFVETYKSLPWKVLKATLAFLSLMTHGTDWPSRLPT